MNTLRVDLDNNLWVHLSAGGLFEKLTLFGNVILEITVEDGSQDKTNKDSNTSATFTFLRNHVILEGEWLPGELLHYFAFTKRYAYCCLCFVPIELVKNKHREEIKLAIGSQQGEAKAIICEDCCCLFNTEPCQGRQKTLLWHVSVLIFVLQIGL